MVLQIAGTSDREKRLDGIKAACEGQGMTSGDIGINEFIGKYSDDIMQAIAAPNKMTLVLRNMGTAEFTPTPKAHKLTR